MKKPSASVRERVLPALTSLKPYLFLLPAILLIGFWSYKPLAETLRYSFYKWGMVPGTTPEYVGLKNFLRLFGNKDFWPSLRNTGFYLVGMLPFSVIIPLLLAVATENTSGRARRIYRGLLFVPMMIAPVAVTTIFQWLLHPGNGIINYVLKGIGLTRDYIAFFSDAQFARWAILFISGWKMIGFSTLMFSAALTGIDTQYYDAGKLDGAGRIRQFFDLTIPLVSPTIMLMIMMSILFSSQWTFAYIDVLTRGGPFSTTTNVYYLMYKFGFSDMNVGLSAAASVLFFFLFGGMAILLQALSKRLSFYDR